MCMLSFSVWVAGFSPTYRRTQPTAQRIRMMGRRSRISVRLRMRFPSCSESCVYGRLLSLRILDSDLECVVLS
jgi:hypothetical protein